MNEYIIKNPRHIHYGCIGTISEDYKVAQTDQYIMMFSSCMHGVDRAAVEYRDLDSIVDKRR